MERGLAALGLVACVACGSGDRPPAGGYTPPNDPPSSGGGFAASHGLPTFPECSEPTTFVYVVSEDARLFRFEPDKLTFTLVGSIGCAMAGAFSMAVDRTGIAWLGTQDGNLYAVSIADASCEATTLAPGQNGFQTFGMGFSTNGPTSTNETLYVVDDELGMQQMGRGLAFIDLRSFALTPIGNFSGALRGQEAELTGTGDGRLYGFFVSPAGATLAQIEPSSGATGPPTNLPGVADSFSAIAFSFWGGDFWFYSGNAMTRTSRVTRLKKSGDGSLSVVVPDVGGFLIVGAGVSTCAPTTPPM